MSKLFGRWLNLGRIHRETGQETPVPKKLGPGSSISIGLHHAEDDPNMMLGSIAVTESNYEGFKRERHQLAGVFEKLADVHSRQRVFRMNDLNGWGQQSSVRPIS